MLRKWIQLGYNTFDSAAPFAETNAFTIQTTEFLVELKLKEGLRAAWAGPEFV